jgi:hypothetical protein
MSNFSTFFPSSGGGGGSNVNTYSSINLFPTIAKSSQLQTTSSSIKINWPSITPVVAAFYSVWTSDKVFRGDLKLGSFTGGTYDYEIQNDGGAAWVYFTGLGSATPDIFITASSGYSTFMNTPNWNAFTGLYVPEGEGTYLATGNTVSTQDASLYPLATPLSASNSSLTNVLNYTVADLQIIYYNTVSGSLTVAERKRRTYNLSGSVYVAEGLATAGDMKTFSRTSSGVDTGWTLDASQPAGASSMSAMQALGTRNTSSLPGRFGDGATSCYDQFADRYIALWLAWGSALSTSCNGGTAITGTAGAAGFVSANSGSEVGSGVITNQYNNHLNGSAYSCSNLAVNVAAFGQNEITTAVNGQLMNPFLVVDPSDGLIYMNWKRNATDFVFKTIDTTGTTLTDITSQTTVTNSPRFAMENGNQVSPTIESGVTVWYYVVNSATYRSTGFNVAGVQQFSIMPYDGNAILATGFMQVSAGSFMGTNDTQLNLFNITSSVSYSYGDSTERAVIGGSGTTTSGILAGLDGNLPMTVLKKLS